MKHIYRNGSSLLAVVMISSLAPSARGATFEIHLQPDGTFEAPQTGSDWVEINEGDEVVFTGLERTDGIVQVNNPSAYTVDPCGVELARPYDAPGGIPDPNEFTGPLRKGVSGIMSLGPTTKPDQTASLRDVDRGVVAPTVSACPAVNTFPQWIVLDQSDGHYYELCRDKSASNETMPKTFANPDVDGIIIRINWNEIETAPDYFDFDKLDAQMDEAVRSGKVFTLDFRAGIWGVPLHQYAGYGGLITPIEFWTTFDENPKDQTSCGGQYSLPSPGDTHFRDAYIAFVTAVIEHVRGDTARWQGLAHFKLTGVNFNTSEGKTAKLCNQACRAVDPKFCSSQKWVEIEATNPGLGWTPARLYAYYVEVGTAIYEATLHQKSIGFQLIQDGYPISDALNDNYGVYNPPGLAGDDGNPADDHLLPAFDEQTMTVLNLGQQGRLFNLAAAPDPVAAKAFVVQHSGLQPNPEDAYWGRPGGYVCAYNQQIVSTVGSPYYGMATFPLAGGWAWSALENAGLGCPNKWNRREGYEGQLTGWQTVVGVFTPNEASSALNNATTNSNGVYVELYEENLWTIRHTRGVGPSAAPLSDNPADADFAFNKNLHAWSNELHTRRKIIADSYNPTNNPFLRDPFPTSHSHRFVKNLAPGERKHYTFISPYKCKNGGWEQNHPGSPGLRRVGEIVVNGVP